MTCPEQSKESIHYEIKIHGKLDPKWSEWFANFLITYTNGDTILEGDLPDQSALFGLLSKIHDIGLTLIRVDRR